VGAEDPDDPDDLYGLALEEFVAARDALAKRLRAGGDRAAADAVKRLPKPSAAAWAVNQAVRSQPRAARALWTAGDELAATQERLLAGDADRDALRAATAAEREALAPLLEAARGLLTGSGGAVSETALARVEESLHAAALDPEVRPDVAAGRLAKELRHVGMGTLSAAAPGRSPSRSRSGRSSATAAGQAKAADEGKRSGGGATAAGGAKRAGGPTRGRAAERAAGDRRAERDTDDRRAERDAAKERVEAARRERAAARDALVSARERSRDARAEAKAAVRAADAARRDADRATAAAEEAAEGEQAAQTALDEAEAALRAARETV
jgi:hypothetical protein